MKKLHYFLFSMRVVYVRDNLERGRDLNVLIATDKPFVNRLDLGKAQQQAQVRFMQEFDPKREADIKDVFISAVSNLGEMTEEEFHAAHNEAVAAEAASQPEPEGLPVEPELVAKTEQVN